MNKHIFFLLIICLFNGCITLNGYIYVSPDYVKQETLICVECKIISSGTMSFLRKKEDKCELLSFSYRIDIKRHTAYCTLREKSIYDISDKTILKKFWLTSAEFRRCKY